MPRVIDNADFRGGYATDLPAERMEANMVLKAENLYWKDGLVSRGGKALYSTLTTYATVCAGVFRAYLNGVWQNIGAHDNAGYVEFWRSTGTTWNAISTSVKFQTAYKMKMDQLGDYVVAVNGYDRPHVIYYSTLTTAYVLTSLDRYDERTISSFDWWAGSRFTTGTTEYVDESTEAYSTGGRTFHVTPTTLSSDGHYVVSDYPFTKVVYSSVDNVGSTATVAYHYWGSSGGWKVLTSLLELEPQWTTSTGRSTAIDDRTMEIPYLTDWVKVGTTTMGVNLENRFAVRVTFPNPSTAAAHAGKVTPSDIHYLTRIMGDERPSMVRTHNNRIYLGSGNNIQISPYNGITNWSAFDVEYFQDGGPTIENMVSFQDYLLVVKAGALYGFYGNSYENWTKRKLSNQGSNWGDSVAVIGELVAFLARDGIRLWNGTENVLVSKHILSDIDTWTKTGANAAFYKGFYVISFPQSSIILVADPDTFRRDDMGDGRISFFKWTDLRADSLTWQIGANDDGLLVGVTNSTTPRLTKFDNGANIDETTVPFNKIFKSRYMSQATPQTYKRYTRMKPDISGAGTWTLTMSVDDGDSVTTDIAVTLGITSTYTVTTHYTTDISVPYQMDGKNLSFQLQTQTTMPATVYGFSCEVETRRY